jgi:hypothetical protein
MHIVHLAYWTLPDPGGDESSPNAPAQNPTSGSYQPRFAPIPPLYFGGRVNSEIWRLPDGEQARHPRHSLC